MEKINYEDASVVIIDDNEEVLESVKEALEFEKMKVQIFSNPIEGLEFIKNNKVDVLLLDYYMPEMNGSEVVKELREFNNETIVILQTGYADKVPPLDMIDSINIQGYVDKGEGIDKLILTTKSAIKTSELVKKIKQQEEQLDAQEYRNQFLGKFLNRLMGEIGERSFAMAGNIIALEEYAEEISPDIREVYKRNVNNIKNSTEKLNELIKSLELESANVTISELKDILTNLFEVTLSAKDINLNIKNNTDNQYLIIPCNARVLIYILVDVIEYLIESKINQIDVICDRENDSLNIKICNEIKSDDLFSKINNLAMFDEKIKIINEYNQIVINI